MRSSCSTAFVHRTVPDKQGINTQYAHSSLTSVTVDGEDLPREPLHGNRKQITSFP